MIKICSFLKKTGGKAEIQEDSRNGCGAVGGQGNREGAALARGAFHLNPAPMGHGNGLGDTQSQAGSAASLGPGFGSPVKTVEDLLLLFNGKAYPRVRDAHMGPRAVAAQGERHPAARRGVLNGVVDQVHQEPLEVLPISLDCQPAPLRRN